MKIFLALIIGILIGAGALWFYGTRQGKSAVQQTGQQIESAARSAQDAVQDKLRSWNLRSDDIKDELARTGKIVRQKAREAGQAVSNATADARTTAAIKGKFLTSRELSSLSISVNTTDGVVTLSGSVSSAEEISKAMLIAMETDGVREVISTLQVKAQKQP